MRMHRNPYFLLLLSCIGLSTAWYSISALIELAKFYSQTELAPIESILWDIEEKNDEEYYLAAQYTFKAGGKAVIGSWKGPKFRNSIAAKQALPAISLQNKVVYYSSWNSNNSTLQKKFPIKQCVSACVLWGLLLYFIWLGNYVSRKVWNG